MHRRFPYFPFLPFRLASRCVVASGIEEWKEFKATMHRRTPYFSFSFFYHSNWHQGAWLRVELKNRKNLKRRCIVALQNFADRKRETSHLLDRLDAEQLEATGEYAGGQVGQFQAAGSKLRCFRVFD